jgi:hypothetical protein
VSEGTKFLHSQKQSCSVDSKSCRSKFIKNFFPERRVKMFITQVISHYIVTRFELVRGFTCFQFYFFVNQKLV